MFATMPSGRWVASVAAVMAAGAPGAHAQVAFGESTWVIEDGDGLLLPIFPDEGAPDINSTSAGLSFTGDASVLFVDPLDPSSFGNLLAFGAFRRFTTGAQPVEVDVQWTANGRVVNGDLLNDSGLQFQALAGIETDTNGLPGSDDAVLVTELGQVNFMLGAGGSMEFDYTETTDVELMLPANSTFYLTTQFALAGVAPDNPPPGGPSPVLHSIEFGGASAFQGFELELTWQVVPAPGPVAAFALAGLAFTRRRR